jgi:hypothetical protein
VTTNPADHPLGTILRHPESGRLAVRFQQDDTTGRGMHAWYVPAPGPRDARVLHHVEVRGWELVELPAGVADVARAVLERQAVEVARLIRERDEAQAAHRSAQQQMIRFEQQRDAWKAALGVEPSDIDTTPEHAMASRPAVPADAADLAWSACMDDDEFNRLASDQILEVIRRTLKAVAPAPVSGSYTTEDGEQ